MLLGRSLCPACLLLRRPHVCMSKHSNVQLAGAGAHRRCSWSCSIGQAVQTQPAVPQPDVLPSGMDNLTGHSSTAVQQYSVTLPAHARWSSVLHLAGQASCLLIEPLMLSHGTTAPSVLSHAPVTSIAGVAACQLLAVREHWLLCRTRLLHLEPDNVLRPVTQSVSVTPYSRQSMQ